jgi:hypothetical protein
VPAPAGTGGVVMAIASSPRAAGPRWTSSPSEGATRPPTAAPASTSLPTSACTQPATGKAVPVYDSAGNGSVEAPSRVRRRGSREANGARPIGSVSRSWRTRS